jgi:hypothetical protein
MLGMIDRMLQDRRFPFPRYCNMDSDACLDSVTRDRLGLRIGGIFVIFVTSFCGTLGPILLKRRSWCPTAFFE